MQLNSSTWTSDLSPAIDKDAELNPTFLFSIDLKQKILPDLLKLRTKAKKPDIKFSQYT